MPPEVRRRLLIGRSTHTLEQARAAREEPVDYVAFGPVFGTRSKHSPYAARGLALLADVVRLVAPRPVIAIGGIDASQRARDHARGCRRRGRDLRRGGGRRSRAGRARPGGRLAGDPGAVTPLGDRFASALGLVVMIFVAWLVSSDRRAMPWRTIAWGVGLQLALAVVLLKTVVGRIFFDAMSVLAEALSRYVDAGVEFVFGGLIPGDFSFAIQVLPIIIFMGSLFAILYHLGIMQRVVNALARVLSRTMGTSGAESLAAIGNIFVGMTESALVVRPYLERMTRSELFSLMTVGMSTVAGSVMLTYVKMLGSGDYAGHLATASLLSAPAGILIAKVMIPEREVPETISGGHAATERTSRNVIDAAAQGATAGLRLAAYVGALLIAFVALIALVNDGLGGLGGWRRHRGPHPPAHPRRRCWRRWRG